MIQNSTFSTKGSTNHSLIHRISLIFIDFKPLYFTSNVLKLDFENSPKPLLKRFGGSPFRHRFWHWLLFTQSIGGYITSSLVATPHEEAEDIAAAMLGVTHGGANVAGSICFSM
jgi:hypothetical protein